MIRRIFTLVVLAGAIITSYAQQYELYDLNSQLESRSISFENPTGEPGKGGQAESELGVGRKGAPAKTIKPQEQISLCDIRGPGTIRHIWMTGTWLNHSFLKDKSKARTELLRNIIISVYWDGQEHPSVECPLGDFMGLAHSKITAYESAVHSIGEEGALNIWLPMPFTKKAKIVLTNESGLKFDFFYQIDYTINDRHLDDVGRLHVCFRRENPTTRKNDFELLPKREGKGRFIGAVVGVRTLHPGWWGEGEIKFYMDGDNEFPTICGTGSEDWIGLSYGVQNTTYQYHGCNLNYQADSTILTYDYRQKENVEMSPTYISMYRWYIKDPIFWKKECRVTIQQIGCCLYEREDDWSTATFWYEPVPSAPIPKIPNCEVRVGDLDMLHTINN